MHTGSGDTSRLHRMRFVSVGGRSERAWPELPRLATAASVAHPSPQGTLQGGFLRRQRLLPPRVQRDQGLPLRLDL